MSQEVFEMIGILKERELETQLALQCAPLLMKIKVSNLLNVHKSNKKTVMKLFSNTAISYSIIYESENNIIFLLYHKCELISYLKKKNVRAFMKLHGYSNFELSNIFKEFSKKYIDYKNRKGIFPHEMGVLLGYPLSDVVGFMDNQGKNYLHTGYWKVYSNLSDTLQLFEKYSQAQKMVVQMVSQGILIEDIINNNYIYGYKQIAN